MAYNSPYSQMKPAWHPDRIQAFREGKKPHPIHVHFVLSDLCNQSCTFCAYRMPGGQSSELFVTPETRNPNRQMDTDKALEIVEDCAALGVEAIQFTGGGEPTVHSDYLEVIDAAQQHHIDTALITNGVKLDPASPTVRRLTWIRVSVDAGSAEDYAATRHCPLGHWDKVWSNIETLGKTYTGVLGIGFVVTPENYEALPQAAHRAKEAGARNIRIGAVFSDQGVGFYGDKIWAIAEVIAEAKRQYDDAAFEVVDLFGRRLNDLEIGSPEEPDCYYQYVTPYIGADLNVYRCCTLAYTRRGVVGSLKHQRFREAVLSYEPFDARGCARCMFAGQNQVIRALIHEPAHVNFI